VATDYYATLGVARDASPDEIKRAYRRLARELHPDVNPDPTTQERFKEVTAAYEVLSDPEKRQMYDLGADPRSPGGGSPFGPGGAAGFGFGDIMDAFFGGGGSRGPKPRVRRGQDALIRVTIDLAEAAFGSVKEIQVDTALVCPTCTGTGCATGYTPTECSMCRGRGEIQSVQRSFLGQVMTSRPCPQCQG
jgi:molecular chaperone DnaJ